jgi:tetratricopeptide repeat protein
MLSRKERNEGGTAVIRILVTASAAVLCFAVALWAADGKDNKSGDKGDKAAASEDSPLVKKCREKLNTKITVDFKDTRLEDCLKEIKGMIEDPSIYYATGVSKNQSVTYAAKDKPAKDVLHEMFKDRGLGYIIHRKANDGDRYEGWIQIVQGDERGDEAGKKETTAKSSAKTPAKTPAKSDTPPATDEEKNEKLAQSKLKQAKSFLQDGQTDDARDFCEQIVKKYPNTKAAGEAKEMLEKLKKK